MKKKVGVFVDISNICASLREMYGEGAAVNFEALLNRAKEEGEVVMSSAYCTVNLSRNGTTLPKRLKHLGFTDVNRRFVVMDDEGKPVSGLPDTNCDVEMAFDVGLKVGQYKLNKVILVTGDHQFADVARRLRNSGVEVHVIGPDKCTSYHLIVEATSFEYISKAGLLMSNGSSNQTTSNNSGGAVGLVKNGGEVQVRRAA
jgi:uncharacterized LabA/DUF88 family protein